MAKLLTFDGQVINPTAYTRTCIYIYIFFFYTYKVGTTTAFGQFYS